MSEPNRLGAKEAARRIERGELVAEDLLRSCLERIAARENDVRAWSYLVPRIALAQAKAADAPLHGIPVGVKDIFDTYDMPTEYGSRIYAGHQPRADAASVALARRAGATILGKTATCEFATFVPTMTRNPHDLARTPGGSSSGSAAAVADFMVPLAFGTQTAGSVIRPGSYCGVVAYKPTYNFLPRAGVKAEADSLDTVGLFARSVEDVAFFASALTGRRGLEASVERPRIAICRTHEWESVQPEMAQCLERAARTLPLEETVLPERFRGLRAAHAAILWYEVSRSFADEFMRSPELIDPKLRERCAAGFAMEVDEYVDALSYAAACRASLEDAFGEHDVLLAPAATGEAPLGEATGDIAMNVVWTLLHTPCVSVPAGRGPNGMPLGLQVIGRIGDDARTLACAKWLHSRLQGGGP
ncbi:MAG TPA: amidase [Burkholderiales bacterium]|nr:amidase [Burkholderiales bacterium]